MCLVSLIIVSWPIEAPYVWRTEMSEDLNRAIESLNNDDPELSSLDLFSLDIGDEGIFD